MEQALISVIVPVYNIETYVEKCIRSIREQTYRNLEIIVVNDGATDQSGNICHKIADTDSRIQVIDQENGGLSEARNVGLRIAKGEYIAFIDGDDYIDAQMYEKLYARITSDQSELALCNIRYVDDEGQCLSAGNFDLNAGVLDEKTFWEGYHGNLHIPYVVAWNKLYKKEIFEDIAFDKGKIHEDEFILHKIISRCEKISVLTDPLYNYVQRSESIMGGAYNVKRLDAVEAFNIRLSYFAGKYKCFIRWNMLRTLGVLIDAKEHLDFSVEINKERYNELCKIYKKNFRRYISELDIVLIVKSLLFCYSRPVYMWLRRIIKEGSKI